MKKILSLIMILGVLSTSAMAFEGENPRLVSSLKKNFTGARNISWKDIKGANIVQANFTYEQQQMKAFFDEEGALIASARYVTKEVLPLVVSKTLSSRYANYELTDAIEYHSEGDTSYLLTIENGKRRLTLRAYASGHMYIFKKEKINSEKK